ncbi:hypothetical protein TH62_07765 [Bacillus sp. TH008]|nr:hypothetical protein TH62_07765 [Bacillus sp. TH008]
MADKASAKASPVNGQIKTLQTQPNLTKSEDHPGESGLLSAVFIQPAAKLRVQDHFRDQLLFDPFFPVDYSLKKRQIQSISGLSFVAEMINPFSTSMRSVSIISALYFDNKKIPHPKG